MLDEFLNDRDAEPLGTSNPPDRFLSVDEIIMALGKLELKRVLHMGQEAILDPCYPLIAEIIHNQFGCKNVLLTNGYEMPNLKHTDKVEFGIKAITNRLHRHYTGKSNKRVLKNFKNIYASGIEMVVESVFIPSYIDIEETERIIDFIANIDKTLTYVILPYFKAGDNPWRRPTPTEMEITAKIAQKKLSNVHFFRGDEDLQHKVISIFPKSIHNNEIRESKIPCSVFGLEKSIENQRLVNNIRL
nr:radical SAM protein [Dehalococcoides mccartyi]